MAIKRILYISGRTVSLFTISRKQLIDTQVYGHDEDGLTAFSEDIKSQPCYRTWILVDITEEEFRVENLPHVFGNDQKAMLNRKLLNLFRETRFRQAQKQEREQEGRRDDVFLISGITNPEMLDPWVERLLNENIPIPGVHSLPLLHQQLFKLIKPADQYVILISQGEMSGMRQTFFVNGKLKVSRLTPTRRLDGRAYMEQSVSETNRFWHYISSTRLAPEDAVVHITILGNEEFVEISKQHQLDNPFMKFNFANIDEYIKKLRFGGISDSSHADEFFALLLASSNVADPYATPAEKRFNYHFLASRGLVATGAAAWLYVLFALPLQVIDGLAIYHDLTATLNQQQLVMRQYEAARRTVPAAPAPGPDMQATVDFYQHINRFPSSPMPYLKTIGRILQGSGDIDIKELNWASTPTPEHFPEQDKTPSAGSQPANTAQNEALKMYPVLVLTGSIDVQKGIRQAVRKVDSIRQQMLNTNGIQKVDVLTYPLEIDPGKTLSGGENTSTLEYTRRKFSLRITWGPVS